MESLADIDWARWEPIDRATLVFVVLDGRVLLIHKRRGLGAGKVNAPGGRLEPGESPLAAAVRECEEEVLATPLGLAEAGELRFQFVDGHSIHVWVFRAQGLRGEPHETAEALPFWAPLDEIPYAQMWADDAIWLPHLLARRRFAGTFLFAGDRMLDHQLTLVEAQP